MDQSDKSVVAKETVFNANELATVLDVGIVCTFAFGFFRLNELVSIPFWVSVSVIFLVLMGLGCLLFVLFRMIKKTNDNNPNHRASTRIQKKPWLFFRKFVLSGQFAITAVLFFYPSKYTNREDLKEFRGEVMKVWSDNNRERHVKYKTKTSEQEKLISAYMNDRTIKLNKNDKISGLLGSPNEGEFVELSVNNKQIYTYEQYLEKVQWVYRNLGIVFSLLSIAGYSWILYSMNFFH